MTTREVGNRAEDLAAERLVALGYRILARNFRVREGEIDIIARQGNSLCFVEVRSRHDARHGSPADTVDRKKRRRLAAAAGRYLLREKLSDAVCRFDFVAVEGPDRIEVIPDAFRLEDC